MKTRIEREPKVSIQVHYDGRALKHFGLKKNEPVWVNTDAPSRVVGFRKFIALSDSFQFDRGECIWLVDVRHPDGTVEGLRYDEWFSARGYANEDLIEESIADMDRRMTLIRYS